MYIKRFNYDNVGPIEKLSVTASFSNNNPNPLIFVGENGSGKSVLLSNIVDALYELANKAFNNATQKSQNGGYMYYKGISRSQIKVGKDFLCSYIEFEQEANKIEYIFKSGNKSYIEYCNESNLLFNGLLNWNNAIDYKNITADENLSKKIFEENVICFFGPDRYEKPYWMGDKYYSSSENNHIEIKNRINGTLYAPISIHEITSENLLWLLDIIVDSRADINRLTDGRLLIENVNIQDLLLLSRARKNIEAIMSEILGQDIYFSLNWRNTNESRLNIKSRNTDEIIVPTLDSLSTGQIALFNIFSTIIRYADNNNINNSINISDITGIVIIDEIELHLHSYLQRDVLPKLIRRFPKVQFIITSHSPLFLLGMNEVFGGDGFDLYQMPTATEINVEMFSEFQNAYDYYANTQKHHDEIIKAIKSKTEKALVVTEGATDWKHMLAAFNALKEHQEYAELFSNLEFSFLMYEPKNSTKESELKLEMGCSPLAAMCESFAKIKQSRNVIFIADRDDKDTLKVLGNGNASYKSWGNNVYSFVLPLPESRISTPDICIEHLYSDSEIKTESVDETTQVRRRLYIGNEFDENGIATDINRFCCNRNACGSCKINIIEGSKKERVIGLISEKETNFALPKMEFAENVLNRIAPFDKFNFSNFIPIFKIIKEILNQ